MAGHPVLKPHPTLADIQAYIVLTNNFRGHDTSLQTCLLLLTEEVGELVKASRKATGIRIDAAKPHEANIAEEVADVFWMLTSICNSLGIDLEQAFRDKEIQNMARTWQ